MSRSSADIAAVYPRSREIADTAIRRRGLHSPPDWSLCMTLLDLSSTGLHDLGSIAA